MRERGQMNVTRRGFFILAGASLLGMAGCSKDDGGEVESNSPVTATSVPQETNQRQDLQIAESGFYVDSNGYSHYAVIVKNPNAEWAAESITLSVTSKDANGTVVGTSMDSLTMLFPGGTAAICGSTYDAAPASTLDFDLSVPDAAWSKQDMTQAEFESAFHLISINEIPGEFDTTFTGEAVNETDGAFTLSKVNVVLRDEAGAIVGGYSGYIGTTDFQPHTTAAYSISEMGVPAHASIEAYLDCGYPVTQ